MFSLQDLVSLAENDLERNMKDKVKRSDSSAISANAEGRNCTVLKVVPSENGNYQFFPFRKKPCLFFSINIRLH